MIEKIATWNKDSADEIINNKGFKNLFDLLIDISKFTPHEVISYDSDYDEKIMKKILKNHIFKHEKTTTEKNITHVIKIERHARYGIDFYVLYQITKNNVIRF
ncbi:MAG: hypothetical protein WC002_10005 [Candidatus Muiribacteriota bacterium]|nr:hypothetical protein [Candidatus Absconditabacterales bacterium]